MNDGPNVTNCFSFSRTLRKLHNYWVYAEEKHHKQTKITSHTHTQLWVYKVGSLDNNKDTQTENIRRCFIFFIHERKLKQTEKKTTKKWWNSTKMNMWNITFRNREEVWTPEKTEIVCADASLFVYRWRWWWYRGVEVGRSRRQETDEATSSFFGDESARFRPATRPLRSSSPPQKRVRFSSDFFVQFTFNYSPLPLQLRIALLLSIYSSISEFLSFLRMCNKKGKRQRWWTKFTLRYPVVLF